MTSRRRRLGAFTLLEVLGAVLVLGLIYTVLARAAMVGLRSEGIDRRRAEASLLVDRELAMLESVIGSAPLQAGASSREEEFFRIAVEVLPQDLMELVPPSLREQVLEGVDAELGSLLVNDRGDSRVQRILVAVEWDEGEGVERVERLTYAFDTSDLAALFPAEAGEEDATGDDDGLSPEQAQEALLEQMRQQLEAPQ